jgi:hypothetical protein
MFERMPDNAAAERTERVAAFVVIALVFIAIVWPELHYMPIWDGRVYADCAINAASHGLAGLSMESLRCAGHPTQGYLAILAASQLLRPGDIAALHFTDIVLGLLALASIRVVLTRVFPDPAIARQLDFVTLLCAVHPVVLSTLLQVNVDFGVYVFFFASLAALTSGRFMWTAVAGVLLCFSKETGVLAYAVMVGLDVLFRVLRTPGTFTERVKRVLPMWVTTIPLALFVLHVLRWNATHAKPAVWKQGWQRGTIDGFKFFDLSDPIFLSYAAGLFLLGFMWLISATIGADLAVAGVRMARRLPQRVVRGADPGRLAYLTLLTVVLTYVLTSYRTWSNLRYFALIYPLLVILAFAAMLRLGAVTRTRYAAMTVVGALFLFATYQSADPVSRAVYGTFRAGPRDMYRMASITGEHAGPGIDDLVYNLQFTGFHWALNAMFATMRPTAATTVVFPQANRWGLWAPLDARTFERVASHAGTITPDYADQAMVGARGERMPHELWLVEQPNDADTLAVRSLHHFYIDADSARYTARGLTITARHLVRRDVPVLPSGEHR